MAGPGRAPRWTRSRRDRRRARPSGWRRRSTRTAWRDLPLRLRACLPLSATTAATRAAAGTRARRPRRFPTHRPSQTLSTSWSSSSTKTSSTVGGVTCVGHPPASACVHFANSILVLVFLLVPLPLPLAVKARSVSAMDPSGQFDAKTVITDWDEAEVQRFFAHLGYPQYDFQIRGMFACSSPLDIRSHLMCAQSTASAATFLHSSAPTTSRSLVSPPLASVWPSSAQYTTSSSPTTSPSTKTTMCPHVRLAAPYCRHPCSLPRPAEADGRENLTVDRLYDMIREQGPSLFPL
jgi:hypothetical protein